MVDEVDKSRDLTVVLESQLARQLDIDDEPWVAFRALLETYLIIFTDFQRYAIIVNYRYSFPDYNYVLDYISNNLVTI